MLPVGVFYAILYRYAIAAPLLDDYDATLGFLLRQQQLHGFLPKLLACLSDQQAEYKFLLEHLLIAAQFGLTGHLSLRLFVLLGNLLLLPILFVFTSDLFPEIAWRERLPLLLPAAYLACQLTYAEVLNWTVASLNAFAVVAFVLLTLHFLVRRSPVCLALACASLMLACAASTNAFLLAPIGAAILWAERRWAAIALWCGCFAAMLWIYLFRYQHIPHPPGPKLVTRLLFFLSFLGGAVEDMHHQPIPGAAIALGLLLLSVFVHAALSGYARRNTVMMALATWTVLTAATVAWFRSSMGVSQSLSGRYKLYCMLLLVFCYGYVADRIRQSRSLSRRRKSLLWRAAMALVLPFYLAGTVLGAQFLERRHDYLVVGMRHFLADPDHNAPLYAPNDAAGATPALGEEERRTLHEAIERHIFTMPPLP